MSSSPTLTVRAAVRMKRSKEATLTLPDGINLYEHSCETMPELEDGSVSLVVTSPPYWVSPEDTAMAPALLRNAGGGVPGDYAALLDLLSRCFAEVWRVLKPGGFACVIVASTIVSGTVYPLPFDLLVRLRDVGWQVKEDLVWRRWRSWDRRAGSLLKQPYPGYFFPNRVHEHVLILKKPGAPIYAGKHDDQKWGSAVLDAVEAARPEASAGKAFYTGEMASSIWNISPVIPQKKSGNHPCPFPEELAFRLISLYSYRGDVVLDPFTGSGTVAKVAHRLGRRFTGYEINPAFAAVAKQRVLDGTPVKRERKVARFYDLSSTDVSLVDAPQIPKAGDKLDRFCYGVGNGGSDGTS